MVLNKMNSNSSEIYYGVYIPYTSSDNNENEITTKPHVFTDIKEALELVKQYKKGRFKVFNNKFDATKFSLSGIEIVSNYESETASLMGEKSVPFRSLKPQQLIGFRKMIEKNNLEVVKELVWENPRYLISNGDTPVILQEGARYNALHFATKFNNAAICEFILETISSVDFLKMLYGDNEHSLVDNSARAQILRDLYLNTPDKGLNETPLHFAVKYGALACVEILTSYPECDKLLKNKFGQQAKDIIGQRNDKIDNTTKEKIAMLLDEPFYVPVFRAEDNTMIPSVGLIFSPTQSPKVSETRDPCSPRMEIHAFAGPMHKNEAETFRKKWKTPTDRNVLNVSSPNFSATGKHRMCDLEKGLERVGRKLAHDCSVEWKEYWSFLDTFADIASSDGIALLEKYLQSKINSKLVEIKALNCLERKDDKTVDLISPMSEFCANFSKLIISDNLSNSINHKMPIGFNLINYNEDNQLSPNILPFLTVEKCIRVVVPRINYLLRSNCAEMIDKLQKEIHHLATSVSSFKNDERFKNVDFHVLHSRTAYCIAVKILDHREELSSTLINLLVECSKLNHTAINQHFACIFKQILVHLDQASNDVPVDIETEEECIAVWNQMPRCECNLNLIASERNLRQTTPTTNRNSFKSKKALWGKKLDFGEETYVDVATIVEEDTDIFFTPRSSPIDPQLLNDTDSDSEQMYDAENDGLFSVYINGDKPTKTDADVYEAISSVEISPNQYPNVYFWKHSIRQFSEAERSRWPVASSSKIKSPTKLPPVTPTRTWFRIMGAYSPRNCLT